MGTVRRLAAAILAASMLLVGCADTTQAGQLSTHLRDDHGISMSAEQINQASYRVCPQLASKKRWNLIVKDMQTQEPQLSTDEAKTVINQISAHLCTR